MSDNRVTLNDAIKEAKIPTESNHGLYNCEVCGRAYEVPWVAIPVLLRCDCGGRLEPAVRQ